MRVEVAAPAGAEDRECLVAAHRGSIDAVGGEGVEDVGDRDEAPLDRNRLAGQSPGYPRGVEGSSGITPANTSRRECASRESLGVTGLILLQFRIL
jgi:hypothetical protein